jgi:hypothetical protein
MSGWGCPHEYDGKCQKVLNKPCDIGMKGCVLFGRSSGGQSRTVRRGWAARAAT